jgi:O-antigen ligase
MARRRKEPGQTGKRWWTGSMSDWITRLLCVSALAIPLVISPGGRDSFRLPKELAFCAEMIVLIALVLIGLILRELDWKALEWRHPAVLLPLVVVAWTGVTTIVSTNRALSAPVLLYATGAAIVFIATFLVARARSLRMLHWVLWSGIINATLHLAVALQIVENPLPLAQDLMGHLAATGLLGNANDVGTALLPIAIGATAAAIASKKHRLFHACTAAIIMAAMTASVAIAAVGAMLIALGSMALVWNWRRALVLILSLTVALGLLAVVYEPLRTRAQQMVTAAETAQWDDLSNGRLTAFAAALEMFRDHPVTGVGPGTFGWQYYPYRVEVAERSPDILGVTVPSRFNFEETHNDHLEVLAETGAPGYALLLGSLVLLASGSLRRPIQVMKERDESARFARLAQLPLAVAFGVIALAQYPLQLTSSLTTLLFLSALCMAWRDDFSVRGHGGE